MSWLRVGPSKYSDRILAIDACEYKKPLPTNLRGSRKAYMLTRAGAINLALGRMETASHTHGEFVAGRTICCAHDHADVDRRRFLYVARAC